MVVADFIFIFQAPFCLMALLAPPAQNDVILRAATMLANIFTTMREKKLGSEALPTGHSSESFETIFMFLNDAERMPILKSKVFYLTKNDNEDITYQASRLYKYISDSG